MINNILLIGIGGFLGAISRYIVFLCSDNFYHKFNFPLGTLIVNAFGSLLIGMTLALSVKYNLFARHTIGHYIFVTGFLGAFTTFSTFSQDNLILFLEKNYGFLLLNIALNLFLAFGFIVAGYFLIKIFDNIT